MELKKTIQSIVEWVWQRIQSLPKFLLAVIKTKTGRRIVAGLLVVAAKQIGIELPFEKVAEILSAIGLNAGADQVVAGIVGLIAADGMFRANDTKKDFMNALNPNAKKYFPTQDDPMQLRTQVINKRPQAVSYYESADGGLKVVSTAGRKEILPWADLNLYQRKVYQELDKQG